MRTDLFSAAVSLIAFALIVAGVARWSTGGALIAGGVLLFAWSGMFDIAVQRDDDQT
jgi:energy-converting hydrogenase Eha subunit G